MTSTETAEVTTAPTLLAPSRTEIVSRQIVAIGIWLYGVCQLFLFDVDRLVSDALPYWLRWIVEFKFLILLAIVAAALMLAPKRRLGVWALYIFFYPISRFALAVLYITLIVIKLKSWPVIFAAISLVLSFFGSFIFNFVASAVLLVGCAIVLDANKPIYLWLGVGLLLALLTAFLVRRFIALFRPSRLFGLYTRTLSWILDWGRRRFFVDEEVRGLPTSKLTTQQLEKHLNNMQMAVLSAETCVFLQAKFREYRSGAMPVAFYLTNFFLLLALAIIMLGFVNYGIYRADPAQFQITDNHHSYFDFFYYSFSALFLQGIPEIGRMGVIAKVIWMFETFIAAVLVGMFVTLFFALRQNLDDAAINAAIEKLNAERSAMSEFVEAEIGTKWSDAIAQLEAIKGGLSTAISVLRVASGTA